MGVTQNPKQTGKISFHSSKMVYSSAFIIGQEQDKVGGAFSEKQIYQGYLSEFNIWNRLLSESEIMGMGNCSLLLKGDIFSWNRSNLELFGKAKFDQISDFTDLCQEKIMFIFPKKRPLIDSSLLCSSLGGNLVVPKSGKENSNLMNVFKEYEDQCIDSSNIAIWIGLERKGLE